MVTVVLALLVVSQSTLWTATFAQNDEALRMVKLFDSRVLESSKVALEDIPEIEQILPQNAGWVHIAQDVNDDGETRTHVSVQNALMNLLWPLNFSSEPGKGVETIATSSLEMSSIREYFESYGIQDFTLTETPVDAETSIHLIVASPAELLDKNGIHTSLALIQPQGFGHETPGMSGLVGVNIALAQAQWITLFGILGAIAVGLSALINASSHVTIVTSTAGPLGSINTPKKVVQAVTHLRMAIPLVLGLLVGTFLMFILSYPHIDPERGITFPWEVIVSCAAVFMVAIVPLSQESARASLRAIVDWRPGR